MILKLQNSGDPGLPLFSAGKPVNGDHEVF